MALFGAKRKAGGTFVGNMIRAGARTVDSKLTGGSLGLGSGKNMIGGGGSQTPTTTDVPLKPQFDGSINISSGGNSMFDWLKKTWESTAGKIGIIAVGAGILWFVAKKMRWIR